MDKLKELVEKELNNITEINQGNIGLVNKLVDIHKDISNEKYWKIKEEKYMRYRGYESYGEDNYGRRGVRGTGRGRYRESGNYENYGHYDEDEKEEILEKMKEHYQGYNEHMSYGAEGKGIQALNKMFECAYEFIEMLTEDVKSQEEMQLAKKWLKKIGNVM